MIRSRNAVGLALLVVLAGCYHATIETGLTPSPVTIQQNWAMSFVGGLIPPSTVSTLARCPRGVSKVETQLSFLNMVASGFTGGLVTPMTIKVTCAAEQRSAAPSPSAFNLGVANTP